MATPAIVAHHRWCWPGLGISGRAHLGAVCRASRESPVRTPDPTGGENATDYSLQNTVRQALFLPTSREAKYKAKAAIDTFFTRFGDVIQAGLVKGGSELSAGLTGFAWLNVGLTLVWLWIASQLHREHRRMKF